MVAGLPRLRGDGALSLGRFELGVRDGDAFDPRPKANGELHLFAVPFAADDLAASPLGVAHPLANGEEVVLIDKLVEAGRLLGIPLVVDALGSWSLFAGRWFDALPRAVNAAVQLVVLSRQLGRDFA